LASRSKAGWPSVAAAIFSAVAVFLVLRAERKLSQLVLGGLGESFSTRVYSAPFPVQGSTVAPDRLRGRLDRLGYRPVDQVAGPGEYSWSSPELSVFLRGFERPAPGQVPGPVSFIWRGGRWEGSGILEPELVTELSGAKKVRREPAELHEIPQALREAVIAAEDKRFYTHWGLDPRAIARSTWRNVSDDGVLQGGSTITQQLVKNLFLTPQRTFRRKLAEAGLALYLELRYSKDKILTIYLNHIYLGQDGSTSVAGVKAAARYYFDKPLAELSVSECALIGGIIRSPYRYNPRRDPLEAQARRDFVLRRMREEGYLNPEQAAAALTEPLQPTPRPPKLERRDHDYFVAEVVRQATPHYGEDVLFRHGLSLYTTMDAVLQRAAQRAVSKAQRQAALVALESSTGRVLALTGGKDFAQSQFNRATQAKRQPGSAFKPFIYGAALEKGFTAASLLDDTTRQYQEWKPRNYDGVYLGTASLRTALARSLNAASLDLANKIGPGAAAAYARRLGIESELEETLGLALGASEVTPLELTAAYLPFANGGFKLRPRFLDAVYDADGGLLSAPYAERERVLEPPAAFLMTSLLESVVKEGTARSLPAHGIGGAVAGKTGTTNDGRDAWFIGYTPTLLAGVWAGDDQQKKIGASGARDALPIWAEFLREAAASESEFPIPESGIVTLDIDPVSGLRARSGCPGRREEFFLHGTEPAQDCPLHIGGVKGWFKRLFGR
jgi:penicillin-binding protein 1B